MEGVSFERAEKQPCSICQRWRNVMIVRIIAPFHEDDSIRLNLCEPCQLELASALYQSRGYLPKEHKP